MVAISAKTRDGLGKVLASRKAKPQDKVIRAAPPPPPAAVNDFAAAHGDYVPDGLRGTINRGGTPIARWRRDNMLSDQQLYAIQYCLKLWERAGRHTKLTQDLLAIAGQPAASGIPQQEAMDELRRIQDKIPPRYWQVFENVCRWDMPAGTAGSDLATNSRSAVDRAFVCVCFVADLIATWKRF